MSLGALRVLEIGLIAAEGERFIRQHSGPM